MRKAEEVEEEGGHADKTNRKSMIPWKNNMKILLDQVLPRPFCLTAPRVLPRIWLRKGKGT